MTGKKITEEDAAMYVGRAWMPVWSRKKSSEAAEEERKSMEAAVAQISRYVREHGKYFGEVEESERPFAFDLEGVVIAGRIDLVRRTAGGKKEIIDFKTSGSNVVAKEQAELQMDLYSLGLEKSINLDVGRRAVHFLEDGFVCGSGWDAARSSAAGKKLCGIVGKIKTGDFKPRTEYCPGCTEFKGICPYFTNSTGSRKNNGGRA
jgi:hypothetical protein